MRTLETHLESALNSRNEPYLQLQYCIDDGFTWLNAPNPLIYYKLGDLTLTVRSFGSALFSAYAIRLKRGAYYEQTAHYETTSHYFVNKKYLTQKTQVEIQATIIPQGTYSKYSVDGNQTYAQIIDAICLEYGYTATYEDPTNALWDNIFYPAGRTLVLQSPHAIFTLLRQKLFIYAQDDNDGEIYFRQWLDDRVVGTFDHPPLETISTFDYKQQYSLQYRTLMWRDETASIHYYPRIDLFPDLPYYNLGYLESTASTPEIYQSWHLNEDKYYFHLKYQDGDIIHCSSGTYQIQVFEVFDHTLAPRLHLQFLALPKFTVTEGGPLPSTIESAAPYTPLNTSHFSGILDVFDNNLQAAMETIDDHNHFGVYAELLAMNAFTYQQFINGSVDQIQLRVQGHSTQTTNLQTWEQSDGTVVASMSNAGVFTQNITLSAPASAEYGIFETVTVSAGAADISGAHRGLYLAMTVYGSGGATNAVTGLNFALANYNTGTMAALYGCNGTVHDYATSGTVTLMAGLRGNCAVRDAGNVTAAAAVLAVTPVKASTGNIVSSYGLWVNTMGISGFTNAYGIYLDNQSGATNNYAIVTNSGDIIFNNAGSANADLTWKTDNYNGIFGDASNDSIVLMSNSAGKVGFFGATAIARHAHIADASDAATVITVCNHILSVLEEYGLLASA
jgi:hypothetical protein